MSIDIDWECTTSGPDGELLAERIRSFIHDKFQHVTLPRFIRSVAVNSFEFGTVCPDLEIRDLCDPFPDFYEEDEDNLSEGSEEATQIRDAEGHRKSSWTDPWQADQTSRPDGGLHTGMAMHHRLPIPTTEEEAFLRPLRSPINFSDHLNPYFFPRSGTPGILGATSQLGYYCMPLGGLSGTQTPLAAVTRGTPFSSGWRGPLSVSGVDPGLQRDAPGAMQFQSDVEADSSQSRPSTANALPSPNFQAHVDSAPSSLPKGLSSTMDGKRHVCNSHKPDALLSLPGTEGDPPRRLRERKPEDLQVMCRVKYSGDIKLSLTAEILLDYPMPNFVGLPLKLNITGLTFDGVAVLAYIRQRVHFCFLSPEDADALVGGEEESSSETSGNMAIPTSPRRKPPSLLREIRVESEIGRKENGKQVLKNVGKVEKFVLGQVRRIFDEEFVYPSFWTFLV